MGSCSSDSKVYDGKPLWTLIPIGPLRRVASVRSLHNTEVKGEDARAYFNAVLENLYTYRDPEVCDYHEKTNKHLLAHIAADIMAIASIDLRSGTGRTVEYVDREATPWLSLDFHVLEQTAKVFTFSVVEKDPPYEINSWQYGQHWLYLNALYRHLGEMVMTKAPPSRDAETGILSSVHAFCNGLILLWQADHGLNQDRTGTGIDCRHP